MSATPHDPTIATFWEFAGQGSLRFQRCDGCGYVRWPPAGVCPECLGRHSTWVEAGGRGTLWSFAVYHRAYRPELKPFLPYNVALVELECGVRLITQIIDCDVHALEIGQAVEVAYRTILGGKQVPVFRPLAAPGSG